MTVFLINCIICYFFINYLQKDAEKEIEAQAKRIAELEAELKK